MTEIQLPGAPVIVEMLPKTRAAAIEAGAVRFFTGVACVRGHIAERYTLGSGCCTCMDEDTKASKKRVRERILAQRAKKKAANGE